MAPAASLEAARAFVAELARRHHDATHVCFAWRVGWPPAERSADAGEPSGTAGPPILAALRAAGLTDVVAAVVRQYGGTKLGKGGLVRAYGGVVRAALAELPSRVERPRVTLVVEVSYDQLGALRRLIDGDGVRLDSESYEERVKLTLEVASDEHERLCMALAELGIAGAEPDRAP